MTVVRKINAPIAEEDFVAAMEETAIGGKRALMPVRVPRRVVARALSNAALVMASLIVALGLAELLFRLFFPQSIIPRYVESSAHGIRKNIGGVHGYMSTSEYRHGFNTNADGFRGAKDYAIPKPAGTFRIVVLGDSVALGHGVEDDETFSAVLEHALSSTRRTEVVNMGVSGFGTAEELVQLQTVGWRYDPDLVVLSYFPNDPYNNVVSGLFVAKEGVLVRAERGFVPALYIRDRLYSIPGYSFLCQHSHVLNFVRNHLSGFFIERLARQNGISSQTSSALTADESELTALLLAQVMRETADHDVPLVLLNIPLVYQGEVIDNLPRHRLPPLDPARHHLVNVGRVVYRDHAPEQLSYERDSHPKAYAHRLIGEWLAHFIQTNIWKSAKRTSGSREAL